MATTVEQLYTQILGRAPDAEGLAYWQSAFGNSVDPAEQASFMQSVQSVLASAPPAQQAVLAPKLFSEATATGVPVTTVAASIPPPAYVTPTAIAPTAPTPESIAAKLTQQILGQGTTDKWTGEGKGSPQANAADMASILAGIGITDVSQFGQIQKKVVDENGNESIVTTYGNKLTGQEVPNTYSERQSGNAFGGTFQGKGNTGYRVEFDAQGKPLFYTTGASSSDVPSWVKPALILGGAYLGLNAAGLLGGTAGTAGLTAADLAIGGGAYAGTGLTATQLAAAGLSASEIAALSAQDLAIGGGGLGGYAALTPEQIAALTAGDLAIGGGSYGLLGGTAAGLTAADLAMGGGASSVLSGAGGATAGGAVLPTAVTNAITNAGVGSVVNSVLGGGTGTTNLSNLLSGGLGTAGNLLQMQQSREAAQQAQARIDAETAAAKASAAFRPIGMTTRFGTSQFQVDPVTGQLTSAGYTLSPEAKAQQDRFMALSNAGLTQAEQAQSQFAPLQTGAQNLFNLGNQYIAQSPEAVAQNYLNQQMALLQPGRQLELANLQNKLQQQGRGGLSVAQGGTAGATTPELQALYNARATQEAQLAAQAQQAGQQQVAFGAGLLGQGAGAMGQYYAGQQAAYAPYTTAMGQVQNLETLGQQPFNLSTQLGQATSTAGARAGALGLEGARLSTGLATSANATANPYAQALMAAGNPNALYGQALSGLFSGGLQSAFSGTGLGASGFGTGLAYGNQDLGLFL